MKRKRSVSVAQLDDDIKEKILHLPYMWLYVFFSWEPNFAIFFQIGGFFLAVLNFQDPEF